ncbi:hypothetical protein [Actinomadura roseirufa]|nr:hypothetical protein [Actinomadura roseirufa]
MRSRFTERREDIVPRSLRDLIATEAAQSADEKRRQRSRKIMTLRRRT